MGRVIDPDTQKWWEGQSLEARLVFEQCRSTKNDIQNVLTKFTAFFGNSTYMWGNGSVFDNIILESLYRDSGCRFPVRFWNHRDMRTLKHIWNSKCDFPEGGASPKTKESINHNALIDSRVEAIQIIKMMEDIKNA